MFADIAKFADAAYAVEHSDISIETPERKIECRVLGAAVINGAQATKRTSFDSVQDYEAWFSKRQQEWRVDLSDGEIPPTCIVLSTCSYNGIYANERTLVYAAPVYAPAETGA